MSMNVLIATFGAALGAAVLVVGVYVWLNRRRIASDHALKERLGGLQGSSAGTDSISILRGTVVSDSLIDRYLAGKSIAATIEEDTRRSGLGWSAGQFAGFVLLGLMAGVIASLFLDRLAALGVGFAGSLAPFLIVSRAKARRLHKVEEQLPEAIDMLVNSLKAGYSLQAGMNFVGTELPAPVGTEFTRFYDEQRLGMDIRQALQNFTDRLGTLDGRMFVLAILIQRETGGNLSEILGNISSVIRERINFRAQLDVLTSESKMSAVVLALLPVVLFVVLRIVNPTYMTTLTDTDTGKLMMAYGAVSLSVGFIVLRSMAKIEV